MVIANIQSKLITILMFRDVQFSLLKGSVPNLEFPKYTKVYEKASKICFSEFECFGFWQFKNPSIEDREFVENV